MFVTSALPSDQYPESAYAEAELKSAADTGTKAILDAVGAMAILGEMARLRGRDATATRLLQVGAVGGHCWASQQGYEVCEQPGVGEFLAGQPARKRWWRR